MEVGFTEKKENEKESPIGNGVDSLGATGGMVAKAHRNHAIRRQTFYSGLDISSPVFNRIDVQNGMNYGISGVYLLGEYTGVEFIWNHSKANTRAQFTEGGTAPNVFDLRTNQ
jgi:hypothetical protein